MSEDLVFDGPVFNEFEYTRKDVSLMIDTINKQSFICPADTIREALNLDPPAIVMLEKICDYSIDYMKGSEPAIHAMVDHLSSMMNDNYSLVVHYLGGRRKMSLRTSKGKSPLCRTVNGNCVDAMLIHLLKIRRTELPRIKPASHK